MVLFGCVAGTRRRRLLAIARRPVYESADQSGQGIGVSNNDSFIEEVNEELRRDRLYQTFRRYGWIAITVVLLIVIGAAYFEWQRAQARAEAEALGDGLIAYMSADTPEARAAVLADVPVTGDARAIQSLITADVALEDGDPDAAVAALETVATDPETDIIYRDLAALATVMAASEALSSDERLSRLEPLMTPGAPFRLLAMEQTALILADIGSTDEAIEMLENILGDTEVTAGLRLRVSQLIVALGGDLSAG